MLLVSLAFAVLFLLFSDKASASAKTALVICGSKVIPVVFPMSVLSSLVVSRLRMNDGRMRKLCGMLFGLSPQSAVAMISGTLAGFPVGAKCANELYESGVIGKSEAERLTALSSNAGVAFVISVCGVGFFGSARLGIIMYAVECTSILIITLLTARTARAEVGLNKAVTKPVSLPTAVVSSANASVTVTGFIVFFSVISSIICIIFKHLHIHDAIRVIVCGLTEFSEGVKNAAQFGDLGVCLASAFISFGGISVIMQLSAITAKAGLSVKTTVIYKAIEAVISAMIMLLLLKLGFVSSYADTVPVSSVSCVDFAVIPSVFALFALIFGRICK